MHITGVVVRHLVTMSVGQRATVVLALKALSLVTETEYAMHEIMSSDLNVLYQSFQMYWQQNQRCRFQARDGIVNAVCPLLAGMFGVKLSVLLMLIGGNSKEDGDGLIEKRSENTRSEIHMLLVGDPGTGKSQVQRYVSNLSSRCVITSGTSTSSAGLTAAAVKEKGQWILEAGALVLCHRGVCCIDEIDGLKPSESAALHEAMEQQTCSVAKAGMMSTLRTKVSVFGTCNPKGNRRIDPRRPISDQIELSPPLLSRFDIILILLDDMNPESDKVVVDHILRIRGHEALEGPTGADGRYGASPSGFSWNDESLRMYIGWCKSNFKPVMSREAENLLITYYQKRRSLGEDPVTARFLESLIRMSQAHAKLMASDIVGLDDAVVAISIADASVGTSDGGILQIPAHLRMSEAGYFVNSESGDVKMEQLRYAIQDALEN